MPDRGSLLAPHPATRLLRPRRRGARARRRRPPPGAGGAGPPRGHLSSQLEAGNVGRRAGRGGVAALSLEHVGAVQAGRAHAHQHLAEAGFGVGAILNHELPVLDGHGTHARNIPAG
jgi:hypothetical protein